MTSCKKECENHFLAVLAGDTLWRVDMSTISVSIIVIWYFPGFLPSCSHSFSNDLFFFWLWNLSSCDVGTSISTLRWRKRCACMKEAVYCMLSLSHKEHRPLSFPLQYSLCKIVFRTKNKSWKTICSCHGQRIFHAALVSESQFLVIHVSKIYKDFDTWLRQCYRVLSTFWVFVCVSSISCCSSLSYTLSFLSVYLPNPCGLKPQWSCQCLKKQDTLGLSFY